MRQFTGIAATTHRDKHGEHVARELLEKHVVEFNKTQQPFWVYWNHFTTLPPILVVTGQKVERRPDGEYQLVVQGDVIEDTDYKQLAEGEIPSAAMNEMGVWEAVRTTQVAEDILQVLYDPRNFDPKQADPIIESLSDLTPTKSGYYIRKGELPQAIILILGALATGFIARLGEVAADQMMAKAKSLYQDLSRELAKLLTKSKTEQRPDIIFNLTSNRSATVIEGAIENADANALEVAWTKLPELYWQSNELIRRNREDYFSHVTYLFNPVSQKWEVNFLLTRVTHQVILGPRYYDSNHPLSKRWIEENAKYQDTSKGKPSMSIGFIPTDSTDE